MNDTIRAAREHNARLSIHRKLSIETLCGVFLALSLLDIPSPVRPQGWYLQINGVCHHWREVAVNYAELWARSAGSFLSDPMTDLAVHHAHLVDLSLDGHREDYNGSGYVLTPYQIKLIEKHVARLRSFVHDDYNEWSDLLYRIKVFPKLEMARIWDESGPCVWNDLIDTPSLHGLYMNNALLPFNAPALRHLRIDMDNPDWRQSSDIFSPDEPMSEGCQAIPRVFPTIEFIAFLKRSLQLEGLIVTDMPELLSTDLPPAAELHVELSQLRNLHLGGKSWAMGDLLRRIKVPLNAQVFIDTDVMGASTDYNPWEPVLADVVGDYLHLPVYDSLRLSLTPSYDALLQTWSSETCIAPGGLDLPTSLRLSSSASGPAFTLRLPVMSCDQVEPEVLELLTGWRSPLNPDHDRRALNRFQVYELKIGKLLYSRTSRVLHPFSTLKHLDYTDAPRGGSYEPFSMMAEPSVSLMHFVLRSCSASHLTLSWSLLEPLPTKIILEFHLTSTVEEVTLVNFPCAAFPSRKRHDEVTNQQAWISLCSMLQARHNAGSPPISLVLAESTSDMSNMKRADEPEYVHTIGSPYEDAVRVVTEKGYRTIAPFVKSFEDLRMNTWP